jgi:hypothetical protein
MDRVPGRLPNTSSRLIAMAVSLVGEAQSVMLEMKCSREDFLDYCAARKEPPAEELDRLIAKNRELSQTGQTGRTSSQATEVGRHAQSWALW